MLHNKDSDCILDSNAVCTVCRVHHGDSCKVCGGRGYHEPGCYRISWNDKYVQESLNPLLQKLLDWSFVADIREYHGGILIFIPAVASLLSEYRKEQEDEREGHCSVCGK